MLVTHAAREYRATLADDGIDLTPADGGPPRLILWADILDLPTRYAVTAGDCIHSLHTSRRSAEDAAFDLSSAGIPSRVYGVPAGL